MGISIIVESHVDVPERMRAIQDDVFWLFAASEWHRLYAQYVPKQTGDLQDEVDVCPERNHTHGTIRPETVRRTFQPQRQQEPAGLAQMGSGGNSHAAAEACLHSAKGD